MRNAEKARAANRRSYQKHRDRRLADKRAYYQANKDKLIEKAQAWNRANPTKRSKIMVVQNAARRARKRTNGGSIPAKQWKAIAALGFCLYCCGSSNLSRDHFVPLRLGGADALGNIVPACVRCNSRKGANEPAAWVRQNFGEERLKAVQTFLTDQKNTRRAAAGEGSPGA